jgi:uncharacterized protein (TIGR02391 family)
VERISPFAEAHLEAISRVLGDTSDGLTGSEIGALLADVEMPDVSPQFTKWKRLYNAFVEFQNERQFGNHVLVLITRAMAPVRYISSRELFEARRNRLNEVLVFSGFFVRDDGRIGRVAAATTLAEAAQRAGRLHAALTARDVHEDVLAFCRAELLQENYFHAVFEATKSIAAKVRALSSLDGDGAELVQQAFAIGKLGVPVLAINALATETDRGEQRGFVNLLVGLFGTVRNPLAHNPKVEWPMLEQDALDILTLASLIHRKLDRARKL